MFKYIAVKFNLLFVYLYQILSISSLRKFNKKFSKIYIKNKKKKDLNILCEGLWVNPIHFIRLNLFLSSLKSFYKLNITGLCLSSISKIDYILFKTIINTKPKFLQNFNTHESFYLNQKINKSNQFNHKFLPNHILRDIYLKIFKTPSVNFYFKDRNRLKKYIKKICFKYEKIIKEKKIRIAILSHQSNLHMGPLCWVLLKNNIPVFILNGMNHHITIRKMNSLKHVYKPFDDVIDYEIFSKLTFKQKLFYEKKGLISLKKTLLKNKSDFARLNIYRDKKPKFKNINEFKKHYRFDNNKKIFVIMSNCFTDYPNSKKNTWYKDYYEFLFQAIYAAKKTNFNWILKPHPAEHEYGVSMTDLIKTKKIDIGKNIRIWSNSNNFDLLNYVNGIVTASGTSAIEHTCLGKIAICAEESIYSNLKFNKFSKNKKEFINLISNIDKIKLTKKEIQKARIFYYFLMEDLTNFLPSQHYGKKIYKKLINFWQQNEKEIFNEIDLMKNWFKTGSSKYDVYKKLH